MLQPIFMEELKKVVSILKTGGTILYPTDTVWGLGCDALNKQAIDKIFEIKNRPTTKSCIVLVQNEEMLAKYLKEIPFIYQEIKNNWTVPVTYIFPNALKFKSPVLADDNTVAIRIPEDEFCQALLSTFKRPILSTSANISGTNTPRVFEEITASIKDSVDYVVQHRQYESAPQKHSKIVKLLHGDYQIIRE